MRPRQGAPASVTLGGGQHQDPVGTRQPEVDPAHGRRAARTRHEQEEYETSDGLGRPGQGPDLEVGPPVVSAQGKEEDRQRQASRRLSRNGKDVEGHLLRAAGSLFQPTDLSRAGYCRVPVIARKNASAIRA
jgi:hypothetical protein